MKTQLQVADFVIVLKQSRNNYPKSPGKHFWEHNLWLSIRHVRLIGFLCCDSICVLAYCMVTGMRYVGFIS